jgi:hypothetical protein
MFRLLLVVLLLSSAVSADMPVRRPRPNADSPQARKTLFTLADLQPIFPNLSAAKDRENFTHNPAVKNGSHDVWMYSYDQGRMIVMSTVFILPNEKRAEGLYKVLSKELKTNSKGAQDFSKQIPLGQERQIRQITGGGHTMALVMIRQGTKIYDLRCSELEFKSPQQLTQVLQPWLARTR